MLCWQRPWALCSETRCTWRTGS